MNFDVTAATILRVKHGSHAYGLNTPESDLDVKGVCIEPLEYHFGFLQNFEQHIQEASKGHAQDLVIYSLKKFAKLAADCNPNIIEVLFGDDADVLFVNEFGERLRDFRDNFLSLKARYTFSGFAHSQLKRVTVDSQENPYPVSRKDRKHSLHLIRCMRMCKEILETGKVAVKRPDREELLRIKNSCRSYASILEEVSLIDSQCEELYRTSKALPKSPDLVKIDKFVVQLTEDFLRRD